MAIVAVVSGVVGVFTVIRGQSFAGHALADIGTAGGSAAFLVGVSTLYGFVALNVVGGGGDGADRHPRPRGRDLATGIVLGAALGLAALFLYEDTVTSSTTGATVNVLFGSVFTSPARRSRPSIVLGVASLAMILTSLPAPVAQLGQLRAGRRARRPGPPGRRRLPARARLGGVDVRGHDRRDPLDGPLDWTGRHRPSDHRPGPGPPIAVAAASACSPAGSGR